MGSTGSCEDQDRIAAKNFALASTKALWITAEMNRSLPPVIPEKSAALASNAVAMPIARRVLAIWNCEVVLNLGR